MPELPEVEVVRRGLNNELKGNKIDAVILFNPSVVKGNIDSFIALAQSSIINSVERKGKYLIIKFDSGNILSHLRMTGKYRLESVFNYMSQKHDHLGFKVGDKYLIYNDVRRFGRFEYYNSAENLSIKINKIGIDALDSMLKPNLFHQLLKSRNIKLKTFLLNQHIISGIGNIYADEICIRAHMLPHRLTNSINFADADILLSVLKETLNKAITAGGSSISDYVDIYGNRGTFSQYHLAYGKANTYCTVCREAQLVVEKIAGRTTVYCPKHQV